MTADQPAPTPTDDAERRRELLRAMLAAEGLDAPEPEAARPVRAAASDGPAPLTAAQERVWFHEQLAPDGAVYLLSVGIRARGELDADALRAALQDVAADHELLRTTYAADDDGRPGQRVQPELPIPLTVEDLRDVPAAERDDAARRRARDEGRRPIDVASEPPLRGLALRTADDEHLIVLVVHHIACDDVSWGVLLPAIGRAYAARREGRERRPDQLPLQYADVARWEAEARDGDRDADDVAWWRRTLTPPPPRLPLPGARRGDAPPGDVAGQRTLTLDGTLSAAVRRLAAERGATPFMVLLAAFLALAHRVTAERDVAVASPAVLRDDPDLQRLVGNFTNTLVLRQDVDPDESFAALLGRVREDATEAFLRQAVPFDRVVDAVAPGRVAGRAPISDVIFLLYVETLTGTEMPGLELEEVQLHNGTTQFDLTFAVLDHPERLELLAIHREATLDGDAVERLLGQYGALLGAASADPDRPVGTLALGDAPTDADDVPAGMPGRPAADADGAPGPATTTATPDDPAAVSVVERILAQATRRPDAVAVRTATTTLGYGELVARAGRLAAELADRGVAPGDLVAVTAPRDERLAVAVLGVLLRGAGYVPLDPEHPADRRRNTVARCGATAQIVGGPGTAEALVDGVAVLDLDDDALRARIADPAVEPLAPAAISPDDVAYVIHTSGSTGEPKGVAVTHGNLARLLPATAPWIDPREDDVWSLVHSLAFDFSVWELFGPLTSGGSALVVERDVARAPDRLLTLLAEHGVTVLSQTPSAFAALVRSDEEHPRDDLALRHVVFGGEPLDLAVVRRWYARHPDDRPRLTNMYGITETTVHVTALPLDRATVAATSGSPIGRPLTDLTVEVLDPDGRPVPVGVAGELHVSGPGLARGYLGDPERTAARFPTGADGVRRYRTGDLGRRTGDGGLEFLRRIDDQVQVRGFRVETAEVAAALLTHPGVAEAAVLLDDERLVAHVVARADAAGERRLDVLDLRTHVAARLPEHMVPAAYVHHAALPLTVSGKLDRRALRRAAAESAEVAQQPYVAAQDELERQIAAAWQDVLEVDRVGIHDSFFDLGGHSLLLTRVRSRLERELERPLPIVDLYAHPTVSTLAAHLRDDGDGEREQAAATDEIRDRAARQRAAMRRRRAARPGSAPVR